MIQRRWIPGALCATLACAAAGQTLPPGLVKPPPPFATFETPRFEIPSPPKLYSPIEEAARRSAAKLETGRIEVERTEEDEFARSMGIRVLGTGVAVPQDADAAGSIRVIDEAKPSNPTGAKAEPQRSPQ